MPASPEKRSNSRTQRPAPAEQAITDTRAELATLKASMWAPLRSLPKRQLEIVVLRYFGGLSDEEVARRLAISPLAVKQHHARAVRALRQKLGTDEGLFAVLTGSEIIGSDKQETPSIKDQEPPKKSATPHPPQDPIELATPAAEAELLARAGEIARDRLQPLLERKPKSIAAVRLLGLFALRAAQVEVIKERQQKLVEEARAAGASWNDVGLASGTTAQSAFRRWNAEARKKHTKYTRERYYGQRSNKSGKRKPPGSP